MSPNKLKTGNGEGVCIVLHKLCELSIQSKFKFKKPKIQADGGGLDDDQEEVGDEMEGNADIADMNNDD